MTQSDMMIVLFLVTAGKYITMLPALHLNLPVDVDTAVRMRHPSELQTASRLFRFADYYESKQSDSSAPTTGSGVGPNQSLSLSLVLKNLAVRTVGS